MIEFEENNELWLLNFLRLKAYYTYCRPGLMAHRIIAPTRSH